MDIEMPQTVEAFNEAGADYLPGLMGMTFLKITDEEVIATLDVRKSLKAWNGFLHAGTIVTLADTCCGYGTVHSLAQGARGFTTVELKSNFLGTAHDGSIRCTARPLHRGRSTQVWDAEVRTEGSDKSIAHFRCTQMILWPRS